MNKLLTVDDVSSLLRLSKSTIYSYVAKQKMPHIKLGTRVLFETKMLDDWVISRSSSHTPADATGLPDSTAGGDK